MQFRPLDLPDVVLITPRRHEDARGFFSEVYSERAFAAAGIACRFVQDNHSLSRERGTIRGLHFQSPPHAQAKLVRVVRGAVFDVAVDLRRGSPSFGRWTAATLSAENWAQLFVPRGFAHGFCTLAPGTEVIYKVDNHYVPEHDLGLRWDDPALGIAWPVAPQQAVLSEKDKRQPLLRELPDWFD